MKKIFSILILSCLFGLFTTMAQQTSDRIIVVDKVGNYQGFLPERVDSIFFAQVEGKVAADVEIFSVKEGKSPTISLGIKRTPSCYAYRICLVEPNAAVYLQDEAMAAAYIERFGSELYYEDFESGDLSGFDEFVPNADYSVATLGYDRYGIACSVSKATFHTQSVAIIGNPKVEYKIEDVQQKSFTITFTPNSDVSTYYYCSFEKGTFQQQFEMWGPGFGFNTPSQMVEFFCGSTLRGTNTNTWSDMIPDTEYEVYVAMKDKAGNFSDFAIVPVKTLKYGGTGEAEVSILIGEFEYNTEQSAYLQRVIFTANKETAFFRDMLLDKSALESGEWTEEKVIEYLKSDPYEGQNPYWNLYVKDDYKWYVEPQTTYMAYAIGQNIDGIWGKLSSYEFTTPEGKGILTMPAKAPQLKSTMPEKASPATITQNSASGSNFVLPNAKKLQIIGK